MKNRAMAFASRVLNGVGIKEEKHIEMGQAMHWRRPCNPDEIKLTLERRS